jgi:hypothetical protein
MASQKQVDSVIVTNAEPPERLSIGLDQIANIVPAAGTNRSAV